MHVIIWWSSPSQRVSLYFTLCTRVGHTPSLQKCLSYRLHAHPQSRQTQSSRCISLELQERLSYRLHAHPLSTQGQSSRCISLEHSGVARARVSSSDADHGGSVLLDSGRTLTSRYYSTHRHGPALNSPQLQTHFYTTHQHISAPSVGCISVAAGYTGAGPCFHHMMVPRTASTIRRNMTGSLSWLLYRYEAPICCTQA